MMNTRLWHIVVSLILSTVMASGALASVGKVIIAKGDTFAVDASNATRSLKRRSEIHEGDTLITGANSEIHIRFQDNAVLALRADSKLVINEYHAAGNGQDEKVLMELLSGGFRTITGAFGKTDKDAYQIKTPNASIGIRGTNYEALLKNDELMVGVYQGGVRLQNPSGSMNLGSDSAFSFAQVTGSSGNFQGLVEPPAELKQPLATSFNSPATRNEESGGEDDDSAQLKNEDENLLVENLFANNEENQRPARPPARPLLNTLSSVLPADATLEDIKALAEEYDLLEFADARLTQGQIRDLLDNPTVGFVVVNEDPTGFRLPVYTPTNNFNAGIGSFTSAGNPLSFDITLNAGDDSYTITIDLSTNCTTSCNVVSEINGQIQNDVGMIDTTNVPAPIQVTTASGKLVFTGLTDESNANIVFDNFQGALAETLAEQMGFCQTGVCNGTYNMGAPSVNDYSHATHFGYVLPGNTGPIFVNYESESIYALQGGYIAPDNVFRGNDNAPIVDFTPVELSQDTTIQWGYWNTSAANPALLLKDQSSLAIADQIGSPYFFVKAPPAKQAAMQGVKTLSTVVDWYATSSTASGMDSMSGSGTLNASLAVDFGTAAATGNVNYQSSNGTWDIDYVGEIKSAQFFSDYGYGTLTNGSTLEAVGHVDGLFTDADTGLGFVGGFGFQTTDDSHNAQGVFVIKE